MNKHYLACDLGADSGRLILGTLTAGRLTLEELHRFANKPVEANGCLHWNIPALLGELMTGLKKAAGRGVAVSSISADSWGVDYVLLDDRGEILEPVYHYRDPRCAQGVEAALAKISWPEIFAETGLQFLQFNTLFQLAAETPERMQKTRLMLGIGDAFNHWLCGEARFEESLASTTQLYNPKTRTWSTPLLRALELPADIFPPVVESGTVLGPLKPSLAEETGLKGVQVVASCSHDTGAAVAAVPGRGSGWAYLSSGTWSLMGVETTEPVITDTCRELNFTNELGHGGSVRLLKNIIGLWLVQESRRAWAKAGQEFSFADLERMALDSPAFVSLIDPGDTRFLGPGAMPERIAAYCRETGQPVPSGPGATMRCIYESLALLYRRTIGQLETLIGHRLERLHIVGGGSKDGTLNQFAANSLQIPVHTGPIEGTAIGNILVQAIALGDLPSLAAARQVVRDSFAMGTVQPADADQWNAAYARFERLLEKAKPAA